MTPVFQTRFGRGNGNCLTACIASVLDLAIDQVAEFADSHEEWFAALSDFCEALDLTLLYWGSEVHQGVFASNTDLIILLSVAGEEELHAVVGKAVIEERPRPGHSGWRAEVIHDPNPRGTGPVESAFGFLIVKRNRQIVSGTNGRPKWTV
jgi:hypothetical protein